MPVISRCSIKAGAVIFCCILPGFFICAEVAASYFFLVDIYVVGVHQWGFELVGKVDQCRAVGSAFHHLLGVCVPLTRRIRHGHHTKIDFPLSLLVQIGDPP